MCHPLHCRNELNLWNLKITRGDYLFIYFKYVCHGNRDICCFLHGYDSLLNCDEDIYLFKYFYLKYEPL